MAHVRFNDRIGPNGEKILFVEELQSDWHSEGRKLGYKIEKVPTKPDGLPEGYEVRRQKNNAGEFFGDKYAVVKEGENLVTPYVFTKEKAREWAINYFKDNQPVAGVPDAPFKSSWHELATKRMLRYAAENGYDKLSFIDGAETANRYDLSKKISEVMYNETAQALYAYDKAGENVLLERGVPPEKIADYIGKEPAERLLNQPLDKMPAGAEDVKTKRLRGEDLKVGGDWAFNLYDRMIPQFLKKYGKKFGAKVEDVEVRLSDPEEAALTGISADEVEATNFKAIDITPQMRGEDGVMGGQVRFTPSTPGTRTPTQSTPTSQSVNLVTDKIYRLPDEDKEERKDRAMEILKQFSKNKNANRNTKKAQ